MARDKFAVLEIELESAFTRLKRSNDPNERKIWLREIRKIINKMDELVHHEGGKIYSRSGLQNTQASRMQP